MTRSGVWGLWLLAACSVSVGNPDAGTLSGSFAMPVAFVGFAPVAGLDGGAALAIDLSDVDYSATCNALDGGDQPAGQDLVIEVLAPNGAVTVGTYPINANPDPDAGFAPDPFDGGAIAETLILNSGVLPVTSATSISGVVVLTRVDANGVDGTLQLSMLEVDGDAGGQLVGSFAAAPCAIVGGGE